MNEKNNSMLSAYLKVICFITMYSGLFVGFIYRKRNGRLLFYYLLMACTIETVPFLFPVDKDWVYRVATFLYICFFSFYYSRILKKFRRIIFALGLLVSVFSLYIIQSSDEGFPVALGPTLAFFYIILSLGWLFNEIMNPGEEFIVRKQVFWVSAALLLWSVCFLFKILPMYWLEMNDLPLLILIGNIFLVTNIISYGLLIIALTREI